MTFFFSMHHLKNVNYLFANQQNDTCGIIARFDFAQSDVPAHDDAVARLRSNLIVSNPLSVIEQITYLLFIKRLDDLHTLEESKAENRHNKRTLRGALP